MMLARDSGYEVFFSMHHAQVDRERSVLKAFYNRHVEGVIVLSSVLGEDIPALQESMGVPIVLVSPLVHSSHRYAVQTNDFGGARSGTDYLVGLGHRRIAHIGAPEWTAPGGDRLRGYRAALQAHGIPWDPELVFEGDAHETGGSEGVKALLAMTDAPTAILCFNDLTAAGVLHERSDDGPAAA